MQRARIVLVAVAVLLAGCSEETPLRLPSGPGTPPSTAVVSSTSPSTTVAATTSMAPEPPPPDGVKADSWCLERADFGDPAESPYLLPFPAGEEYSVTQGYCVSEGGGHGEQLAYDFNLPVGRSVLASRSGTVKEVWEGSPDDGQGYGEHNYLMVEHADGTLAFYAHLHQDGVLVDVGDHVEVGQVIAISGNSGLTGEPHLHFGVYRNWPPYEGLDVPISFQNAQGPLDVHGGLMTHRHYLALPDPGLTGNGDS